MRDRADSEKDSQLKHSLVFLLDVDNTLLDNDRLKADLAIKIRELVGSERAARFWELYEELRQEHDYVDYPGTIERWSMAYPDTGLGQKIAHVLDTIPFEKYLYAGVHEVIGYLWTLGTPVILSDGDPVFQPRKIEMSGLAAAVRNNVLIFVHKEDELPQVFARYPADHYVVVDDKPRILAALEGACPTTFTTILVLQGKYAEDASYRPAPDRIVPAIEDLLLLRREDLLAGSRVRPS